MYKGCIKSMASKRKTNHSAEQRWETIAKNSKVENIEELQETKNA